MIVLLKNRMINYTKKKIQKKIIHNSKSSKKNNLPRFDQEKINLSTFHSIPRKKIISSSKHLFATISTTIPLEIGRPSRIYLVNWNINSVPLQNPEEFSVDGMRQRIGRVKSVSQKRPPPPLFGGVARSGGPPVSRFPQRQLDQSRRKTGSDRSPIHALRYPSTMMLRTEGAGHL